MNRTFIPITFFALAFVASVPMPAQAQPPIVVEGAPTILVGYADLDLSGPAGQSVLNGRVRRAAEDLCFDTGLRGAREAMRQRRCLDFALGHARDQVDRAIAQYGSPQYAARTDIQVGR